LDSDHGLRDFFGEIFPDQIRESVIVRSRGIGMVVCGLGRRLVGGIRFRNLVCWLPSSLFYFCLADPCGNACSGRLARFVFHISIYLGDAIGEIR
jgi:hypothetical protein